MNNFRKINDDILKDWFEFRDEILGRTLDEEDKKHDILLDEIAERILKNVPEQNKKYVKKQIDLIDENFLDYICYWNEKYYIAGFSDAVKLIFNSLI